MPEIAGRGIKKPQMGEMFLGSDLILRVDDKINLGFWLTLRLTPAEVRDLFAAHLRWLLQSEQWEAVKVLTKTFEMSISGKPVDPRSSG